jgi:hypothetical protein
MRYHLEYFVQALLSSLWGLQSYEIFTRSVLFNPHMFATISMYDHAPMLVSLVHARSIIPKNWSYQILQAAQVYMHYNFISVTP